MSQLIKKEEIQKAKFDADIIRLTIQQIIKDFNQFGLDINFPDKLQNAYDDLFDQLQLHIDHLLTNQHQRLLSLLYQIDIGENKITKLAEEKQSYTLAEVITEAVLERELLKVLTRLYFKRMNK